MSRPKMCPACGGSGRYPPAPYFKCPHCADLPGPAASYEAGFRAGIEAAAKQALSIAEDLGDERAEQARTLSAFASTLRNIKPEDGA